MSTPKQRPWQRCRRKPWWMTEKRWILSAVCKETNPNAYRGAYCFGLIFLNVYPRAYKISRFRLEFRPIRITIHINMDDLLEAPHTVHATANETGALPATLPKVLRPTIFTIADIKRWNFDCKHRKNVHFYCFRVCPNPICRRRAEERAAMTTLSPPLKWTLGNIAEIPIISKEGLLSEQNTTCTLK